MKKNDVRTFLSVGSDGGNILSLLQTGGTSRLRTSLCTGLTVYLLLICGFLQVSAQTTFSATGLPAAIPDPGNVNRMISVSGLSGTVATANEVQVNVTVAHGWAGDVLVGITPPGGSEIIILTHLGTSGYSNSDFVVGNPISFRQNASSQLPQANDIVIPAGIYLPTGSGNGAYVPGSLASLVGATRNGEWNIRVTDVEAIIAGTLHAASITFFDVTPPCTTPTAYAVTGGGTSCNGSTTPIGLADSESGINYQLVLGSSTNIGAPVAGTGNAIDFTPQSTAGTYTVVATNTVGGCTADMTGSAVVTSASFYITGISAANISACNDQGTTCETDDTFTADVTVTYPSKPATGTLSLTGTDIVGTVTPADVASIGATSHTFTGVTMLADGDDIDLTAAFSNGCDYNDSEVATAPSCGGGEFVPENIEVSGFGNSECDNNGTYVPGDMVNGAPAWYLPGLPIRIAWSSTDNRWEIQYFDTEITLAFAANATGSMANLPCTGGWTDPFGLGCIDPEVILSGGCGSLEGNAPAGSTNDISMANASDCNDNSTPDPSDDYFTADVTVTFEFAPCSGTLILDYGTGSKPGAAGRPVEYLAEINACSLLCVTTYTFEDVQLIADGQPVVLTAYFSTGGGEVQMPVGVAPGPCSCPLSDISIDNMSACASQNTTCTTDDSYTADVTVTYFSKPASGTLALTGPNILVAVPPVDVATIGAASHTFTGVTMLADGDDIDLTAAFSEGCAYNDDEVATAPSCGGGAYVPTPITVSGFDNPECPLLNDEYGPDGTYNGAPQWSLIYSLEFEGDIITYTEFIRWTGSEWEFYSETFGLQDAINSTGSITELPCTGWIEGFCGTPTLSGGCGSLEGGGGGSLPCNIDDISIANESACNDNGTTDGTDDYFTADITVTFAYAPATGTLILDYGGTGKPGSANKSMVGLAEVSVSGLQCVTTYTFEDVQLVADGELFGLWAYFSDAFCEYSEEVGPAPASCSCVPPTFTACPGNQTANTSANTCNAVVDYTATAGGSPASAITYSFSGATSGSGDGTGSGSTFNFGTTDVVLTATNDCGSPVCTLTVIVTDNINPSVTCKPHTAQLNAGGTANITPANVYLSGADNCGIVNLVSVSPANLTCANVGANTVTLNVNDGHGNVASCTSSVTVQDLVLPTALCKNATVQLNAAGTGSTTAAAVNNGSSDNCGIASMSLSQTTFTCANYGANTVTLTVTDVNNNIKTCTATVTVQDLIAPTVNCVASLSPSLNAQGEVTITPAMVFLNGADNCGTVNPVSVSPSYFSCNDEGPNTATLTANDGHGNTATCTTTVNILDFIVVTGVTAVNENCGETNGSITITATSLGGQLGYSINGGQSYNLTGVFAGLSDGAYNIVVLAYGTVGCYESYGMVTVGSTGTIQAWYPDLDDDGYSTGQSVQACTPPEPGWYTAGELIATTGDCNNKDPLQHPGQVWFKDADNDGYSNGVVLIQCARPIGFKAAGELAGTGNDCNDANAAIHAGAAEICNSLDDDCDGLIDEGTTGGLTFVGNVSLTSQTAVNNFSSCYSVIQGNLLVQNSGVLNLTNLANLVKVTGNVTIKKTSLLNMNGLHSLDTIGGNLTINGNNFGVSLHSLDGLEDLDWVGGALKVYQNSLLTDCCAIHDLIGAEPNGVGGIISIYSNLTTCDNVAAINADCGGSNIIVPPGSEGSEIGDWGLGIGKVSLLVFPNPVSTSREVTVRIEGEFTEGSLRVFDAMGRTVASQPTISIVGQGGTAEWQLETGNWKTGIYLVQTLLDGVVLTKKLVVE